MAIKHIRSRLITTWQSIVMYVAGVAAVSVVYLYRLSTLVAGISLTEQRTIQSHTITAIKEHVVYAPYKLLQLVFFKVFSPSIFTARLTSVLIGIVLVGLFYFTVSQWFIKRVSFISTVMFASSAWMLHVTRLADPKVMQLSLIAVVACGAWMRARQPNRWSIPICTFIAVTMLYVPGLIWFVGIGCIWQRRTIAILFRKYPLYAALSALVAIILTVPLMLNVTNDRLTLYELLGLQSQPIHSLTNLPMNLLRVPAQLIWRGPQDAQMWLGKAPLVDFFAVVMAILGTYSFAMSWRLDRARIVLGGALLGWILVALGGAVPVHILLPFIYLLMASGIAFMLEQWFRVFPFNPFARGLAYGLIAIAVLTVSWYNVQHYFIAWPQTPATRAVFNRHL